MPSCHPVGMTDGMSIAAAGIQAANQQFDAAASRIATVDTAPSQSQAQASVQAQPDNLPDDIVDMDQAALSLQANLRVFQVSSGLFKSLLDLIG